MSENSILCSQIIQLYQSPSNQSHLFELIDRITQNQILGLLDNYAENAYILDFVSCFLQHKIENINPDFVKKCYHIFIEKVHIDGKWWRLLIERTMSYIPMEQLLENLLNISKETCNQADIRGPKFALREVISYLLQNIHNHSTIFVRIKPILPDIFLLLKEKDLVQYCIRNLMNDVILQTIPRIQDWPFDVQLDIFCDIAARKDNVFHNFIPDITTYTLQRLSAWANLQEKPDDDSNIRRSLLLLQLIIQNHILLLEAKGLVPSIMQFLIHLTNDVLFCNGYIELYLECLEIWNCVALSISEDETRESYYAEILHRVVIVIIQNLLLSQKGGKLLPLLDDTEPNANHQTELDEFILKCIDCSAVICSSARFSSNISKAIFDKMVQDSSDFLNSSDYSGKSTLTQSRDLQTLIFFFGQFAPHFLDQFEDNLDLVKKFLQVVGQLAVNLIQKRIYFLHRLHETLLVNCFHIFQTFYPWIRHLHTTSPQESLTLLNLFSESIIGSLLDHQTSNRVKREASNSLMRLVTVTKIVSLSDLQPISKLFEMLPTLSDTHPDLHPHLDKIHVSISNIIMNQSNMEIFSRTYSQYFNICVSRPFTEFLSKASGDPSHFTDELIRHLKILKQLVKSLEGVKLSLKELFFIQFAPLRQSILSLIPNFNSNIIVQKLIFSLLDSLFKNLISNLEVDFIDNVLGSFVQILGNRDNISRMIHSNHEQKVVKKYLSLQITMFSWAGRKLVPILQKYFPYLKDWIYPAIKNDESSKSIDIKREYYLLLFAILQNHFGVYFAGGVINQVEGSNLYFILSCFLDSFQTLDIHTLQNNIEYLQKLNSSHLVFQRKFFQQEFSSQYATQLTVVLKAHNHEISNERIIKLLYEILKELDNGFPFYYQKYQVRSLSNFKSNNGVIREQEFCQDMLNFVHFS